MHHIFVNENLIDEVNGIILLTASEDKENFNHLVRVLRVGANEAVLCSPVPFNHSFDYKCKVKEISDHELSLLIVEKVKANELAVKINLYQGLPKSDKLEFIIEKAVELGAYSITPVEMEHSVAKMGKKANDKLDRYNKIARSAAEQSKRNIIPEVREAVNFDEMIKKCAGSCNGQPVGENNLLFYEDAEGIGKTKEVISKIKEQVLQNNAAEVNVIIGPEGGFSKEEIDKAKDFGFTILSLGDRILRTETAAVTALSILMYELQK